METTPTCPNCGKALEPNAPLGLCQKCLLEAGFPSATDIGCAVPHFVPPSIEELAPKFPQLDILEYVGQGGMGAVYKACQKQLDRIVALKILPPSAAAGPGFAERFAREARALAKLNHPHIVTLYEFGQGLGLYYFLMEFVDGLNLRQVLTASRLTPKEALAIVPQICDALQYAHERGIVHRDIKPENILLSRNGFVKIADFGVAKIVAQGESEMALAGESPPTTLVLTQAGSTLGTPQYMAPEQLKNSAEVDHRADIYSLGVVFYQMLTGELPSGQVESPSRKVAIDVRLDEVVLRALEKSPERRFQRVADVKERVETISQTPHLGKTPKPRAPHLTAPLLKALGMAGLLVLLSVVAYYEFRNQSPVFAPPDHPNVAPGRIGQDPQTNPASTLSTLGRAGPLSETATTGPRQPGRPERSGQFLNESQQPPGIDPATGLPTAHPGDLTALPTLTEEHQAVDEVQKLIFSHRYEEALQRCLAFHEKFGASSSWIPLLAQWSELGRRYPKAKQALIDIRDQDIRASAEGSGYFNLFMEVSSINRELQDDDATVALFKRIESDQQLAQRCFRVVRPLLVQRGDYELCMTYLGDPERALEEYRQNWERLKAVESRGAALRQRQAEQFRAMQKSNSALATLSAPTEAGPPNLADKNFVDQTCELIEILVAVERKADAELIRDQALTILDDPRLKSAVGDARLRIQKHSLQENLREETGI